MNTALRRDAGSDSRIDSPLDTRSSEPARQIRSAILGLNASAGASIVNRTHRVVRERARNLERQRTHARSLWVPIAICSALFLIIGAAGWSLFEQYDLASTGMVESGDHFFVLLLWFLPVSAALLALVWFKRTHSQSDVHSSRPGAAE